MLISTFSFFSPHTHFPVHSHLWHNEQGRWINRKPFMQEWSNSWMFQVCAKQKPYKRGIEGIISPPEHILHKRHIFNTFEKRERVKYETPKVEWEDSQERCLVNILLFPSWHQIGLPWLSHPGWLPQNNVRTGNSVKEKIIQNSY